MTEHKEVEPAKLNIQTPEEKLLGELMNQNVLRTDRELVAASCIEHLCREINSLREPNTATTQQNETIEFWQKDSADAWDKCEERRLENVQQNERIKDLEAQIEHQRAMLTTFNYERDKMKDKQQNSAIHSEKTVQMYYQAEMEDFEATYLEEGFKSSHQFTEEQKKHIFYNLWMLKQTLQNEVSQVLVLSTGHLTEKTMKDFKAFPWIADHHYGVYFLVNLDYINDYPDDLKNCTIYAANLGVDELKFDVDGRTVEGLEVFNWEKT